MKFQQLELHPLCKKVRKHNGRGVWHFIIQAKFGDSPLVLKEKNISLLQYLSILKILKTIERGTPAPLAVGKIKFLNDWFYMKKGVFIPRVETEELMQKLNTRWFVKNIHTQRQGNHHFHSDAKVIIDLCCGSGVMGISALLAGIRANINTVVIGVDSNAKAARLSNHNAKKLLPPTLVKNYHAFRANIFSNSFLVEIKHRLKKKWPILYDKRFSIKKTSLISNCGIANHVLCNPPYIGIEESENLSSEVLRYDPHTALFADDEGLAYYKRLAALAPFLLKPNGEMGLELGVKAASSIKEIFRQPKFLQTTSPPYSKNNAFKSMKKTKNKSEKFTNSKIQNSLFRVIVMKDMFAKVRFALVKKREEIEENGGINETKKRRNPSNFR